MIPPFADTILSPAPLSVSRQPMDQRARARHHFNLIDSDEPEAMAQLFDSDASYLRPGYPPFLGRSEILRFYTEVRAIREGRHSLETVVVEGDQVAVRGGFSGRLHDGQPIDLRFSDFFTVGSSGRFCRRETFFCAPLT